MLQLSKAFQQCFRRISESIEDLYKKLSIQAFSSVMNPDGYGPGRGKGGTGTFQGFAVFLDAMDTRSRNENSSGEGPASGGPVSAAKTLLFSAQLRPKTGKIKKCAWWTETGELANFKAVPPAGPLPVGPRSGTSAPALQRARSAAR